MIKITVNPNQDPKSYVFNQDVVIIGDGSPESVHICFSAEGLHQNHLKIIRTNESYFIINQANDPFVTYNSQPFGKKRLQPGDLIQIRDHVLRIEELATTPQLAVQEIGIEQNGSAPLAKKQPAKNINPLDSFPDVDCLANDENPEAWFPTDLMEMQDQLNNESEEEKSITVKQSPTRDSAKSFHPPESEYYEDEPEPTRKPKAKATPPLKRPGWKMKALKIAFMSFFLFCVITGLILAEAYFRASSKSEQEEMQAAESLSDFAMALTYASVYHISPQKQNWVDPQFIKKNLIDLLASTSMSCGNIDAQGQFCNSPYFLRFYTNRDFSRFLLIAQPGATLSQWLLPKNALIVDSTLMDLRKTNDMRTLNRLLSEQNPLEGPNGLEVLHTIEQADVISMNTLAKKIANKEFAPPVALAYLKPGAENLIYNSPRYYQLGETFLKKALHIAKHEHNDHDLTMLQSELETLSKFPDLVFYSSEGMQSALQGYHALKKLEMPSSFFTGYLVYGSNGKIANSQLVIDNELEEEAPPMQPLRDANEVASAAPAQEPPPVIHLPKELDGEEKIAPLLRKQADEASDTLMPILHNLNTILLDVIEKDSLTLPPTFYQLLDFYQEKQEKARTALEAMLEELRAANPTLNEFAVDKLLREYGLLDLYHNVKITKKQDKKSVPQAVYPISPGQIGYSLINPTVPLFTTERSSTQRKSRASWVAYINLREVFLPYSSYVTPPLTERYCKTMQCIISQPS